MLSKAFLRSAVSQRGLYTRQGARTFRSYTKRRFCSKPGTATPAEGAKPNNASAPPPPPSEGGGGSGMYILILAALGGGGYYFKDDIAKQLGLDDKAGKKDDTPSVVPAAAEKAEAAPVATPAPVKEAPIKTEVVVDATPSTKSGPTDWKAVREAISNLLESENYDDGSYAPVFVRLAWHSAGTYDKNTKMGGSEGAGMRFSNEGGWGANAGLDVARAKLEPVKAMFPDVTYSDLWSLAGTVAIEEMGGPEFKWRPGRKDHVEEVILPDGLLPDADGRNHLDKPSDHLRDIFYRMGFNDKEIVCLSGAHALGRCHENRSGYWGPWTYAPTTFSNEYYRLLLEERWSKKKTHKGKEWTGPEQYENPSGDLMMLPTDMSLVWDEKFRPYVEQYAKDEDLFFKDFAKAWIKLQELGVKKFHGRRRYYFFGPRE